MFRWKQKKRFSYIASCEEGEFSEGQSIEEANVCPSMGLRCRSVPLRWNHTPSRRRIQVGPHLPSDPNKLSKIAETKRTRASGATMPPIDMAPRTDRTPSSPAHAHTNEADPPLECCSCREQAHDHYEP